MNHADHGPDDVPVLPATGRSSLPAVDPVPSEDVTLCKA